MGKSASSISTIRAGLRELSQPIIDEAVARARRLDSDISVRGRVVLGSPSRILLSLSARSQLIVVGRQGKGALATHLLGSVSQRLMTPARSPVVAVSHPREGVAADVVGRVVLAVGDRATGSHALRFAQAEADRGGFPLRAVHGWHAPGWPASGPDGALSHPALQIQQQERRLVDLLAVLRTDRASADITPIVHAGPADRVLAEFCRPSDLLVFGQHRHGHFVPRRWGRSSRLCGTTFGMRSQ
jgi:nucleotide-binding universal stress UspA family protein